MELNPVGMLEKALFPAMLTCFVFTGPYTGQKYPPPWKDCSAVAFSSRMGLPFEFVDLNTQQFCDRRMGPKRASPEACFRFWFKVAEPHLEG